MMQNTLSTRNVAVGYGSDVVLEDLSFNFQPGELVSLIGPAGSGKTTFLRSLCRQLPLLGGEIRLLGKPLGLYSAGELSERMAVVHPPGHMPPLFQVYEFVAMGRFPNTTWSGRLNDADDRAVISALEQVGTAHLAYRDLDTLTDVETLKICIARAMAGNPEIILMDEPLAGLVQEDRCEIMSLLSKLCQNRRILIIVSHCEPVPVAEGHGRVVSIGKAAPCSRRGAEEHHDMPVVFGWQTDAGKKHLMVTPRREKVFVVAGMGSGTTLYRDLARRGFDISTGILMEDDMDCVVARSIGAACHIQADPRHVSHMLAFEAMIAVERCDMVVDTGFHFTSGNRMNQDLLERALALGKPVFAINRGAPRPEYRSQLRLIRTSHSEAALVEMMERQILQTGDKSA
ncbi:MAG: ABC transporter ATP-binding protein [Desulfobacterales bacterium]|nr:ABC transporter ATP-binding protein [Desulfobacterales bacterium]